jgi:YHS domain-containing protein/predicted small lipoprotein YifL
MLRLRRIPIVAAVLVSSLLAACGQKNVDEFSPQAVAAAAKEAGTVNGLCPIMKKPVVVGDTAEYKGEKFGFCCPGCSVQFLKDPERYVTAMQADAVRYGYKQK